MALSGSFILTRTSGTTYLQGRVEWYATQSTISNESYVTANLILKRTNTGYTTYGTGTFSLNINGAPFNTGSISYSFSSSDTVILSSSVTVTHETGGTKDFTISASYSGDTPIGGSGSQSFPLDTIDRAPPSVGFSTSSITPSSVYISASASTTCDIWQYSINGGSSWTTYSTAAGASAATTISGLSPNTSYTIYVRARKRSNEVYGTSGAQTIKTLGPAILNSVNTLTADNATAQITFNWTVYSTAFTYLLDIMNGSTVITTITIPAQSSTGTSSKTISLTSTQRSAILSHMASFQWFTGTFVITTKSGSTTIGSVSSKTATVQTTAANSAPTFSNSDGFTYLDNLSSTVTITGNNQIMIQGYSQLLISAYAATAKNNASIKQYEATINGVTVTSAATSINIGAVSASGNLILTVKAVDSRGYTVSKQKTITVVAYAKVSISQCNMRRVNEVEALTQIDFAADISKILVSSVNKNAFQSATYRYKKTSDSAYGSYNTISAASIVISDTSISFDSDEFVSLDSNYSYHIQIVITDKLSSDVYLVTLPQGTPLISKRRKKVGINNRNPQSALDVVGDIMMNGYNVQGFVKALNGEDFNDIAAPGIYFYTANPSSSNAPSSAGFLEVLAYSGYIIQRFTAIAAGCALDIRSKLVSSGTWTTWVTK